MSSRKIYTEDKEYTKKFNKKVFICKSENSKGHGRRCIKQHKINADGRKTNNRMSLAQYIWNKHHPEDPVKEDENIHHFDFNPLNDKIGNLRKMKKVDHAKLHAKHDAHMRRIEQWNKAYECKLR